MLGSMPAGEEGDLMLYKLIDHYAERAGVTLRSNVTKGTLVCPRSDDKASEVWTLVNMDGHGGSLTLPRDGHDVLSGKSVACGPSPLVHMSTE